MQATCRKANGRLADNELGPDVTSGRREAAEEFRRQRLGRTAARYAGWHDGVRVDSSCGARATTSTALTIGRHAVLEEVESADVVADVVRHVAVGVDCQQVRASARQRREGVREHRAARATGGAAWQRQGLVKRQRATDIEAVESASAVRRR